MNFLLTPPLSLFLENKMRQKRRKKVYINAFIYRAFFFFIFFSTVLIYLLFRSFRFLFRVQLWTLRVNKSYFYFIFYFTVVLKNLSHYLLAIWQVNDNLVSSDIYFFFCPDRFFACPSLGLEFFLRSFAF